MQEQPIVITGFSKPEEREIYDSIVTTKNVKRAIQYIDFINNNETEASLFSSDDKGMTLLAYALREGHEEVVTKLLSLQKGYEDPILKKNNDGETLVHMVAQGNSEKNFTDLIEAIKDVATEYTKFYFESDNQGKTPLHLASEKGNLVMLRKLLELSTTYNLNQVNVADLAGNTAAHYALQPILVAGDLPENYEIQTSYRALIPLIEAGANIFQRNYQGESVVDHFAKSTQPIILGFFEKLNELESNMIENKNFEKAKKIKEIKNKFVENFEKLIVKNSDLKPIFLQLTRKHSLKEQLFAYFNYDDNAPLRGSYKQVSAEQISDREFGKQSSEEAPFKLEKRDEALYKITTESATPYQVIKRLQNGTTQEMSFIPKTSEIPLRDLGVESKLRLKPYLAKVNNSALRAEVDLIPIPRQRPTTLAKIESDISIQHDADFLGELLHTLNNYEGQLNRRPKGVNASKLICAIYCIVTVISLVLAPTFMSMGGNYQKESWAATDEKMKRELMKESDFYWYFGSGLLFSMIGLPFLLGTLSCLISRIPKTVSPDEGQWQSIQSKVTQIDERLQAATEQEETKNIFTKELVDKFVSHNRELQNKKTVAKAITFFSDIKQDTQLLLKEMYKADKPLSSFKPSSTVITVEELDDDKGERKGLLASASSTSSSYGTGR